MKSKDKYLVAIVALLLFNCSSTKTCDPRDHIVVNYSKIKILDNALFTKATALYIDFPKNIKSQEQYLMKEDFKRAYLAALTLWGTSLILADKYIDESVRRYLANSTFKSEGHSTYNAPIVDVVSCPQDASVIIRIINKREKVLPQKDSILALSQLPGRTIIMNNRDFSFYYDQTNFKTRNGRSINLTVVLAHEIGHSLGLEHDVISNWSIMSPNFNDLKFGISVKDGQKLAQILLQNIDGPSPGFYNAQNCSGLRVISAR